jgi:hypothetical protein
MITSTMSDSLPRMARCPRARVGEDVGHRDGSKSRHEQRFGVSEGPADRTVVGPLEEALRVRLAKADAEDPLYLQTSFGVGSEPGQRQEQLMGGLRILGIVLVVLGVLGLVYGQFSYTKKSHDADLGIMKVSVKEKETVNVPTWAGVAAIAAGAALLVAGRKG